MGKTFRNSNACQICWGKLKLFVAEVFQIEFFVIIEWGWAK
jgi:hypothetical protein